MTCYQTVIDFWFTQSSPQQWWQKDAAFDQLIHDQFADLHQQARQGELYHWRTAEQGRLAEILILDQFSRNLFRDSPLAFTYDPMALALAQEAVALGADKQLTTQQRPFLYMPYMHSESLAIHTLAVSLFKQNNNPDNLEFEMKHQRIIERFGRYPHRNIVLNRDSTEEELAFLQQADSAF
jgi:uncharacterized protein (DUF924 family)